MKYFNHGFLEFFKSLATNNNKEWFHAHKDDYEKNVKLPFEAFVQELIYQIQKFDTSIQLHPKDAILRINKDIRFSKDKSPYNLHCTAFISSGGKKDKGIPGLYLRFSPESLGIMGGCYGPSPKQLQDIRTYISKNIQHFNNLLNEKNFINKFSQIKGETIKRIPENLRDISAKEPLILNKQWYFVAEREPELITSPNLVQEIMEYYHSGKPLNDFFIKATDQPN